MRHFRNGQNKTKTHAKEAFTLVEVIIVTAVLGIVLQIVATILVTIMRQQTAIIRFGDVKKEGDQILSRIKSEIQTKAKGTISAVDSSEICTNATPVSMQNQKFLKKDGSYFTVNYEPPNNPNPGKITLTDSVGPTTTDLSSRKVSITNFTFECAKLGTYANKLISIEFDIQSATNLMLAEGNPSLHYSTKILIKN